MSAAYADTGYEYKFDRSADDKRRERAFGSARRHTFLVRFFRMALPIGSIGLVISMIVFARAPSVGDFDVDIARTTIESNSIVMENPRLTGFDDEDREYRVSASRATQKLTSPDQVRLEDIRAEIIAEGWGETSVTAAGGDFDNSARTLNLFGGIKLNSTEGYRLSMENADIDFTEGTLKTPNPVTIEFQGSQTSGDNLSVTNNGKLIVMEGRVQTTLMPPKKVNEDAEASPAAPVTGPTDPTSTIDAATPPEQG